jgi:hypothetical protein
MRPWPTTQQHQPRPSPLHIVRRPHHHPRLTKALGSEQHPMPRNTATHCRPHSHLNPHQVLIHQARLLQVKASPALRTQVHPAPTHRHPSRGLPRVCRPLLHLQRLLQQVNSVGTRLRHQAFSECLPRPRSSMPTTQRRLVSHQLHNHHPHMLRYRRRDSHHSSISQWHLHHQVATLNSSTAAQVGRYRGPTHKSLPKTCTSSSTGRVSKKLVLSDTRIRTHNRATPTLGRG